MIFFTTYIVLALVFFFLYLAFLGYEDKVKGRRRNKTLDGDRVPASIAIAIFWPMVIPVGLIGYGLYFCAQHAYRTGSAVAKRINSKSNGE